MRKNTRRAKKWIEDLCKSIGVTTLLCALLLCIAGCGSTGDTAASDVRTENSEASASTAATSSAEDKPETEAAASAPAGDADVDLTSLSSTMVYSEVYHMMIEPDDYEGKTVKMEGEFIVYPDEEKGVNYYACIIKDATACCAQGMEFVLTDRYAYPADYPREGETVTVEGTFETYMEGEAKFCHLVDAEIL